MEDTKKSLQETLDYAQVFENETTGEVKPLRLLLKIYRGHWRYIGLSIFFFIIKHSPIYTLPIITANIINFASKPEEYSLTYFWINFAVIMLIIAQNIPLHTVHISYLSKAVRHVEAGLRSTLVRKIQQLSMSFHGELNAGKMQSKILRDVEAIDFLSRQMMLQFIPAIITMAIAIGLTLSHSLLVSTFFLLTVPMCILLVHIFRKKISKTNREFRIKLEEMSGRVSEMVEMIPVTRAHGLEDVEIKKIEGVLHGMKEKGYKLDILEAYFGSSNWVTFQLFQILCLFFTSYLVYLGKMPVGDIVMYQGFFGMILGSVMGVLNVYPNMAKGFESLYSVTEILLSTDTTEYKGKRKLETLKGSIQFDRVGFKYRDSDQHVLDQFSLHVKAGETIAFVGQSGSGKSTVLNLLIGFYRPQKGSILIDGVPMEELDLTTYRRKLAMVLQNNILFSGSIRENITYGLPTISDVKLQQAVDMANLREVIERLPEGLDTKIGEHGGKLSGGQRQRIAIARALVRDPQIIILDEATSALDNESERHVQEAMDRLTSNRTTFIVAHRLSTVRNADRIVVLNKGQIVEVGSYEELVEKRGEFHKLVSLQAM